MAFRALSPRSLLFALVACAIISGCSRAPQATAPPPPPPLTLTVVGSDDLNDGGNAAVVRIYQLAGDANFQRAPVQAFWQNDEGLLGAELVSAKREILLYPGSTEILRVPLEDKAQFLAIAADLRDPDPEHWRAIYPVETVRGKAIAVVVGEDRLNVRVE